MRKRHRDANDCAFIHVLNLFRTITQSSRFSPYPQRADRADLLELERTKGDERHSPEVEPWRRTSATDGASAAHRGAAADHPERAPLEVW
jgi:hypothetical protein